ncbi:MAG: polymer-forming cytoskeletal protein [Thermovenabulum sp.]|uniref:polymer-forming cytoskeletal protein n=1 Tax=Thermovenabulum sp. TaxID=3100335 RepID=UPI003C7A6EBD
MRLYKYFNKAFKENKGAVLITVLLVGSLLILLSVAFSEFSRSDLKASLYYENRVKARYLAEGGLNKAIYELKNNPERLEYIISLAKGKANGIVFDSLSIDEGDLKGNIILKALLESENRLKIISEGSAGNSKFTAYAYLTVIKTYEAFLKLIFASSGFSLNGSSRVEGDIVFLGDVDLKGNFELNGNVYSKGDVELQGSALVTKSIFSLGNVSLEGSADVYGDIYAKGAINISGAANIRGKSHPYYQGSINFPQDMPKLDSDFYKSRATAIYEGPYSVTTLSLNNNIVFIDDEIEEVIDNKGNRKTIVHEGDFSADNLQGSGVIYAKGDVEVKNITGNDNGIIIISEKNITVKNAGNVKNALLFSPNGTVDIGNADFEGSIVARNFYSNGSPVIKYSDAFLNLSDYLPQQNPPKIKIDYIKKEGIY